METSRFKDHGLKMGLGKCKSGGLGSGSNLTPLILCSAVRTISVKLQFYTGSFS